MSKRQRTMSSQRAPPAPKSTVAARKGRSVLRPKKTTTVVGIPRSILSKGEIGVPPQLRTKLRYVANVFGTSTASLQGQCFAANGLYDPDITGVGSQPTYFDQYMALYNHYVVVYSSISCEIVPLSSSMATQVCVLIDDDSTGPTSAFLGITSAKAKSTIVSYNAPTNNKLFLSWSVGDYFTNNPLSDDNLKGNASGNPAELSNFIVQAQSLDGITVSQVYVKCMLTFDVVFIEPKTMTAS